jgi:hypothetical protein
VVPSPSPNKNEAAEGFTMCIVRSLPGLSLLVALLLALPIAGVGAAPRKQQGGAGVKQKVKVKQQQKKNRNHHGLHGTVVSVHHAKGKAGSGIIKVRVHRHRHKHAGNQNVVAKVAKGAIGQKKKRHHTVQIHVNNATKFAAVFKGLVLGKPQVKTVGTGKAKARVVLPGKPKIAKRKVGVSFAAVRKGQHVHVKFVAKHHHLAWEVDILATGKRKQGQNVGKKP